MKKRKVLASILIIVMCCGLLVVLAACPPLYRDSIPVRGAVLNTETELELTSVDYRFFISDFPDFSNGDNFVIPNSNVKVNYTMRNNSSDDVVVPLYLTLDVPYYAYDYEFDATALCKLYGFNTDATHNVTLRCFYDKNRDYYQYDNALKVQKCLNELYDDKQTDIYYVSELPIYKYTFELSDLSSIDGVSILLFESDAWYNTRLFFDKTCSCRRTATGSGYDYYVELDGSSNITFYSIGIELADIEQNVSFCDGAENVIENGGKITAVGSEVITFDDLAMTYYDKGILSETDWYNAVLTVFRNEFECTYGLRFFDISDKLYYMYQCDLTVPAHGSASLTAQMPLYAIIDYYGYTDRVYQYEVEMSNLSKWQGAPNISVSIITDAYCVDSSFTLQQTENGFKSDTFAKTAESLTFTLSDNPNVMSISEANRIKRRKVYIVIFAIIALCYAVPIVTVNVVIGCDNAKRKKAKAAQTDDPSTKI